MSFFGDVVNFEAFNLGDMWKQIQKDPERIFLGAADPFSSKMWGSVTGKDYEPIVDQWGGASDGAYKRAEENGIDTGAGKSMHGVAKAIASIYAGGAASNGMGGMMGGSGSAAGTGMTAGGGSATGMGGGTGLLSSAGGQGFQMGSQGAQLGASSAASSGGGLLSSMKTGMEYVKPISEAAGYAQQAQGLLNQPEQQIQSAPIIVGQGGSQGLTDLANQSQQSTNQQLQLAAQQRQARRNMYRGA